MYLHPSLLTDQDRFFFTNDKGRLTFFTESTAAQRESGYQGYNYIQMFKNNLS